MSAHSASLTVTVGSGGQRIFEYKLTLPHFFKENGCDTLIEGVSFRMMSLLFLCLNNKG
jgi:hypothetical protein